MQTYPVRMRSCLKNSYTPDPVTLTGGTALRAHKDSDRTRTEC